MSCTNHVNVTKTCDICADVVAVDSTALEKAVAKELEIEITDEHIKKLKELLSIGKASEDSKKHD